MLMKGCHQTWSRRPKGKFQKFAEPSRLKQKVEVLQKEILYWKMNLLLAISI
jgi:hypothetical protein